MLRVAALASSTLIASVLAVAGEPPKPSPEAAPPKVATLHFGPIAAENGPGIVGRDLRLEDWQEAARRLDTEKPDLIIVRVNSGDLGEGDPDEAVRFHKLFTELKNKSRVVAWIEHATFCGSLAVLPIEEYHFHPRGSFGAISAGERNLQESPDLGAWKTRAEAAAKEGKHPILLIRAMQDEVPVSVSLSPRGPARFTQDEAGPIVLNRSKDILTLTAEDAVRCGFAKSIASTSEELLASLGYPKVQRVGEAVSAWLDARSKERAEAEKKTTESGRK